jgi:general L-amino acid transport system permease protein
MANTETTIFKFAPARPSPTNNEGLLPWIKSNLSANWQSTLTTIVIGGLLLYFLPRFINWAIFSATIVNNADACRAEGVGACWGVIREKYRLIIFGRYPFDEQWRPLIATVLLVALLVMSCTRIFWKKWLVLLWIVVIAAFFALMYGGVMGLSVVQTDRWGGLPLTIMLATLSIVLCFPIAICVALGRRSNLPAIRTFCTIYVELIRGVPLISVLFMAAFMFPLFMPQGMTVDVLIRVLVGVTLFAAAYMAEVIRGGLQAMPKGQAEAAASIGLSYWQTQFKIILPQALAMVVPGIMNNFIGLFKDTSLVYIVSLYELTGSMGIAFDSDADWRPHKLIGYLFIVAIYFAFCFAMSRYSLWIEKQLNKSKLR